MQEAKHRSLNSQRELKSIPTTYRIPSEDAKLLKSQFPKGIKKYFNNEMKTLVAINYKESQFPKGIKKYFNDEKADILGHTIVSKSQFPKGIKKYFNMERVLSKQ